MENCPYQWEKQRNMVIFHSYVSLPEGGDYVNVSYQLLSSTIDSLLPVIYQLVI